MKNNDYFFDDWAVLIEDIKNGEEKAFVRLYNLLSGKMYSLCLRYTGNKTDADDVFQEAFVKLYKNLNSFRNEGAFEGWARRIFVNVCLDFLKRRQSFLETGDEMPGFSVSDMKVYSKIDMDYLLELVQKLPPRSRTLVNLHLVEGYSHREIGILLGITENSSKSQLQRAKTILKKLLDNERV